MEIGRAWATINDTSEVTLVMFGEDDAPALLGAYTLEGLRLAADPVAQRLVSHPSHHVLTAVARSEHEAGGFQPDHRKEIARLGSAPKSLQCHIVELWQPRPIDGYDRNCYRGLAMLIRSFSRWLWLSISVAWKMVTR